MGTVNDTLNQVIHVTNTQTSFMKTMAYKSIDLEARARRNNLVFRGFVENTGENCTVIVRDFLQNRLAIDSRHLYIARAHRLGKPVSNRRFQSRPIIVNFRDYGDVELIMSKVRHLKGMPFSVDFDCPREIQEACACLWPQFKELKQSNPRSRVHIVYPAKLIQDGRVVRDEIPEWNQYIGANRLSVVNNLGHIKNQRPNKLSVNPTETIMTPSTSQLHLVVRLYILCRELSRQGMTEPHRPCTRPAESTPILVFLWTARLHHLPV